MMDQLSGLYNLDSFSLFEVQVVMPLTRAYFITFYSYLFIPSMKPVDR
jgi:hypothetical protein